MIIRLVTVRNFLLPELLQQFTVRVIYRSERLRLLLKNAAHMMQEFGHRIDQQGRRIVVILLPCWRSLRQRSGTRNLFPRLPRLLFFPFLLRLLVYLRSQPHRLLDHNILDPLELFLAEQPVARKEKG